MARRAIIVGAGPAGLTAALELIRRTDVVPLVLEASDCVGGLCRTVRYRGNRMDLGGHRFFSKSIRVHRFWQELLPLQGGLSWQDLMSQGEVGANADVAPQPDWTDDVMLVRDRVSRIFYRRSFFDYPVSLNWNTLRGLGAARVGRIAASYALAQARPRPERSLEDFLINRFGGELYKTFFADYTRKVWGVPPAEIPASWGAQRIKGVSIKKVLAHALQKATGFGGKANETSLAEQFGYPKFGPGQFWDKVAAKVVAGGGEIRFGARVSGMAAAGDRITAVKVLTAGGEETLVADHVLSSMPMDHLVAGLPRVPEAVLDVARGLVFRDFLTVGVLTRKLRLAAGRVPDQWIYVQEPDVQVGRLQIFNNWSPYLVSDPLRTTWLGLEYFCTAGDELWTRSDDQLQSLAAAELVRMGMVRDADLLDGCVVRAPRAYPAYFGSYGRFGLVKDFLGSFTNLYPIGRNGQHRYNNMDHSMLTAMVAVDLIVSGLPDRSSLWEVNTETDHHEGG